MSSTLSIAMIDSDNQEDDLFLRPLIEDVLDLDLYISNIVKNISLETISKEERFEKIRNEVLCLLKKIEEISQLFPRKSLGTNQNFYDKLISIAGKWAAYASYCGATVSVEGIADYGRAEAESELRAKHRRKIVGKVIKTAIQKTVTVLVERLVKDPRTGKRITRSKSYLVHDEYGNCQVGDIVVAFETRPLSKRKHHSFVAKIKPRHAQHSRTHRIVDVMPYRGQDSSIQ